MSLPVILFYCFLAVLPERVPAEGWRLWPHPVRRPNQSDLRRHHRQHRRHRRPGLCRHRRLRRPGPRAGLQRSRAGDEGHAPGAAHGRFWAAFHRRPPPPADVRTPQTQTGRQQPHQTWRKRLFLLISSHCLIPPLIFGLPAAAIHSLYLILIHNLSTCWKPAITVGLISFDSSSFFLWSLSFSHAPPCCRSAQRFRSMCVCV